MAAIVTDKQPWRQPPQGTRVDANFDAPGMRGAKNVWDFSHATVNSVLPLVGNVPLVGDGPLYISVVSTKYGRALYTTVSGGRVDTNGVDLLAGLSLLTLHCCFVPSGFTTSGCIFGRWDPGSYQFLLRMSGTGTVRCMAITGGTSPDITTTETLISGQLNIVTARLNGASLNLYLNGRKSATSGAASGSIAARGEQTITGGDASLLYTNATRHLYIISNVAQSDAEILDFHSNPWQLFKPRKNVLFFFPSAGGSYSLSLSPGSFVETGQDTSLLASRLLAGAQSTYALTGQPMAPRAARLLSGGQGSYSETGQSALLLASRKLAGSSGNYALTGQAASLLAARVLGLTVGHFALSGQSITLTYNPAGSYTLTMASGSFALTSSPAQLLASRLLQGASGSITLTGRSASFVKAFILAVETGSYTATGEEASLLASRLLSLAAGNYTVTGTDAGIGRQFVLGLEGGTVSYSGPSAALLASRLLQGQYGIYAVTGKAVTLDYSGNAGAPFAAFTFSWPSNSLEFDVGVDSLTFYLSDSDLLTRF